MRGLAHSCGLLAAWLFLAPAAAVGELPKVPEAIPGVAKVDAEKLIKLANRLPELIIIDSRITSDRMQGYIEGSISLPDTRTDCASLGKILPAGNSKALFYCNGVKCGRSVNAIRVAKKCGYKNIFWFRGGFAEWLKKGYPFLRQ